MLNWKLGDYMKCWGRLTKLINVQKWSTHQRKSIGRAVLGSKWNQKKKAGNQKRLSRTCRKERCEADFGDLGERTASSSIFTSTNCRFLKMLIMLLSQNGSNYDIDRRMVVRDTKLKLLCKTMSHPERSFTAISCVSWFVNRYCHS